MTSLATNLEGCNVIVVQSGQMITGHFHYRVIRLSEVEITHLTSVGVSNYRPDDVFVFTVYSYSEEMWIEEQKKEQTDKESVGV